jgi:hypothetical protein
MVAISSNLRALLERVSASGTVLADRPVLGAEGCAFARAWLDSGVAPSWRVIALLLAELVEAGLSARELAPLTYWIDEARVARG